MNIQGENKTQNRLSIDLELALKVINNISINATNNYQPNLKERMLDQNPNISEKQLNYI